MLSGQDIKIVCFVKNDERKIGYEKLFKHPRLFFEAVDFPKTVWPEKIFATLKFYQIWTETTDLRAKMVKERDGQFFAYYFKLLLHRVLARRLMRVVIRFLDSRLIKDRTFKKYFKKYQPSLIICAQLFEEIEVHLVKRAKAEGVKTVCFINTWDKVTARNAFRVLVDKFITYNEIVKTELIENDDVKAQDVYVSGIPQYDYFFDDSALEIIKETFKIEVPKLRTREEFLNSIGLTKDERFIFYAPVGSVYSNDDWAIIDLLTESIKQGQFGSGLELFVRFPPNDFVNKAESDKRKDLHFYAPGIRFSSKRGSDWDMSFADIMSLKETLKYSELVICYASSISIDASIFEKPIININFITRASSLMIKTPTAFYPMTHYQKALKTGAIDLASSKEEMIELIKGYIKSPDENRGNRDNLVARQCQFKDGLAGKRMADFVKSCLT
ncbi:MAG: hypothetical protein WCT25_03830 [Candidatus Paceibacterota bacterium]